MAIFDALKHRNPRLVRNELNRERLVGQLGPTAMRALAGPGARQAASSSSGTTLLRVDGSK